MREIDRRKITKIRRAIKYPVLIFFIRVFILIVRLFPRGLVLKTFAGLGKLVFKFLKKERIKTINNLTMVFGDVKTEIEIHEMAKQVFVNQALNFADYVHTLKYTTREQFSRIVEFVGEEHLREAYDKGNGVLCLMCHVGSWEFSAIMPPVMGYETTAISRPMPNEKIDKLIVGSRQKRGMKNISRGNAYDQLVEVIKKGECLIIMIDQDTQVKGVFIEFMGKQAYTPIGAARLAIETKAPVLPMYMKRLPNNKHQFTILPQLPFVDTGNESDIIENTKIYNKAIEDIILETPDQWVWMHERWKTTPEDIEQFLKKKRENAQAKS